MKDKIVHHPRSPPLTPAFNVGLHVGYLCALLHTAVATYTKKTILRSGVEGGHVRDDSCCSGMCWMHEALTQYTQSGALFCPSTVPRKTCLARRKIGRPLNVTVLLMHTCPRSHTHTHLQTCVQCQITRSGFPPVLGLIARR